MKKSLIALAALAATGAFAQSSVTLTGTFDPSVVNEKVTYGNGYDVSQTLVSNSRQGTSAIIFKGVEDLGGGMTAMFLYEADFSAAVKADGPANATLTNNSLGVLGGEVYTGLAGSFGSIKIGAANTPTLTSQASRQPIGTKLGGGFGGVLGTSHVRESNSLVYASPVFMGGLTVQLGYAFGSTADTSGATAGRTPVNYTAPATEVGSKTDFGVFYAAGPVRTGLTRWISKAVGTATDNTQTNLFTQYDLGAHTLYIGAHNETITTGQVQQSGYNVAAKINVAPTTNILFNYGKLSDLTNTVALDKSILTLGARYDLSKRTSLYTRYVSEKNENVTAATSAKEITSMLVGVQHNF
jgi:predicted porin